MLLIASAVALAAVLAAPTAVFAHDALVSSSPESGEELSNAPATVVLTFTDKILTMGVAVVVVDGSDHDWVVGEPDATEATVTATLDERMPEGGYEMRWRVVSGDGHPISGVIPFTVGDAEPLTRASQPPAVDAGMTDTQSPSTNTTEGVPRFVLVGAGGAVVAVAAFALVQFFRRSPPGDGSDLRAAESSRESHTL